MELEFGGVAEGVEDAGDRSSDQWSVVSCQWLVSEGRGSKVETRRQKLEIGKQKLENGKWKREERFLTAQADRFVPQNLPGRKMRAGAMREEKPSACFVRSRKTIRNANDASRSSIRDAKCANDGGRGGGRVRRLFGI